MKQSRLFWMGAVQMLLIAGLTLTGCSSSDEDENDNIDDNIIMPVNVADGPIAEFFKTELPERDSDSDDYRQTKSFFFDPETLGGVGIMENFFYVINSREELANIYLGDKELPEIDFDKYTLIVGQQIMPFLDFYVGKKELMADNDRLVFNLYARHDSKDDSLLSMMLQHLYFWAVYPKLSQKTIEVNVIREYPNRSTTP